MEQQITLCYKMNRPCDATCVAFRKEFTPNELARSFENLSNTTNPLPASAYGRGLQLLSVSGYTLGATNCLELYLRNFEVLALYQKNTNDPANKD